MVTAHGGANGTGRNSIAYFQFVANNANIKAIEVDVRRRGDLLYISHLPKIFAHKKCLTLKYALQFAKDNNLIINCDLKEAGIFAKVAKEAEAMGIGDNIIFTGKLKPDNTLDAVGRIFANKSFFKDVYKGVASANDIKAYLDTFFCDNLVGINVNYKQVDFAFLADCKKVGLAVSVYTVDKEDIIEKLWEVGVDNITTNIPLVAIKLEKANKLKNKM